MQEHSHPPDVRSGFVEKLQPFSADRVLEIAKARDVAPRPCQTRHETCVERIGDAYEYNRNRARSLLQRFKNGSTVRQDGIEVLRDEIRSFGSNAVGSRSGKLGVDFDILSFDPSHSGKFRAEGSYAPLLVWIGRVAQHQHADAPHPLALLRARRERPSRRRPAEQRDELAAPDHSITSSARASKVGGTSSPSAFAVLRLMASSYLVAACTGRSAGFSPLRMRST